MYNLIPLALGALLLGTLLWKFKVNPWLQKVQDYYKRVSVCGHLEPPSQAALIRLQRLCRFLLKVLIGRVHVLGLENLESTQAPFMYCTNHPSWADAALAPVVLNRQARIMVHPGVFSALGGIGAWIAAPAGAIVAQDGIKDKGLRARGAAVKALVAGEPFVILPEGWTNYKAKMGVCRQGAVKIAKAAGSELGKPIPIVPAFIRYKRYPADWTLKVPSVLFYLLMILLAPFYRRGAVIVIGKPLWSTELSPDDEIATAQLKERIEALDPGVEGMLRIKKTAPILA